MHTPQPPNDSSSGDRLVEQVRNTLDDSVGHVDDITAARLASIRQQALSSSQHNEVTTTDRLAPRPFPYRIAIAASIMLMIITVPIFRDQQPNNNPLAQYDVGVGVQDLAYVDELEFFDTMEMLAILDLLDVFGEESATNEYL